MQTRAVQARVLLRDAVTALLNSRNEIPRVVMQLGCMYGCPGPIAGQTHGVAGVREVQCGNSFAMSTIASRVTGAGCLHARWNELAG